MRRFFTHYWNWEQYQNSIEGKPYAEGTPLDYTAGSQFSKRGIKPGDIVYVLSGMQEKLYLIGKMEVREILYSEDEARSRIGYVPWSAPEHLIARICTPIRLDCRVPVNLVKGLRFISSSGNFRPKFDKKGVLDRQTFRNIRELEPKSAEKLDKLLPQMTGGSNKTPSAWRQAKKQKVSPNINDLVKCIKNQPKSLNKPRQEKQNISTVATIAAQTYKDVRFLTLGIREAFERKGTVLIRDNEMVLDIPNPEGDILLIGRLVGHVYSATEKNPPGIEPVNARWAKIGDCYVGTWIEGHMDFLFTFSLPKI
jgi:hypothetical protein